MKVSTNIIAPLVAAASLASGFVVEMFTEKGCGGNSLGERNVWDNSCAYVNPGFSSYRLKAQSSTFQQGTVYSRQACAGETVWQGCVSGVNSVKVGDCFDLSSPGNALSSYWSPGPCPA